MNLDTLTARLSAYPTDPIVWGLAAEQLLAAGMVEAAVPIAQRAHQLKAELSGQARLAFALARAGQESRAAELIEHTMAASPTDAVTWTWLARTHRTMGRLDASLTCRQAAVAAEPADLHGRLLLAQQLEHADRRSEAREQALFVLERDPGSAPAERVLMRVDHHEGELASAVTRARRILAGTASTSLRRSTQMELARILARLDSPAEAVVAAEAGNQLALEEWGGDPDALLRELKRLAERTELPEIPEPVDAGAMFIMGFPRSGTTLMQQILEQHPSLRTLDETPALDRALDAVLPGLDLSERLDALTPERCEQIRAAWRTRVGPGLVVDKLPLHLARVELVARVFPGTPIVVMVRDPRDCVLSSFLQDFDLNIAMAALTSLPRAAELYASVFTLWHRAARAGGIRALEVKYEDLVADPRGQLETLLTFLELPWDERVLQQRGGAVTTPSYRDVQRPLYKRSVQRWRPFAEQLAPIRPILDPFIEAYGYPLQ